MLSNKNSGRALGVSLAVIYASLITLVTHRLWLGLRPIIISALFVGLCVGCYFAGIWVVDERPSELNKRFPVSSKDLRRRKKEFYDWLDSHGRR